MKEQDIQAKRAHAFSSLLSAHARGHHIVYADELQFNAYQVQARSWAHLHENQEVSKGGLRLPVLYALVLVSERDGLEAFVMGQEPIVRQHALDLFQDLSTRTHPQ